MVRLAGVHHARRLALPIVGNLVVLSLPRAFVLLPPAALPPVARPLVLPPVALPRAPVDLLRAVAPYERVLTGFLADVLPALTPRVLLELRTLPVVRDMLGLRLVFRFRAVLRLVPLVVFEPQASAPPPRRRGG